MSVDNKAILFVGLPATEENFPGLDVFNDVDYYLQSVQGDDTDLGFHDTSEYHDPDRLIGYLLGDSGSYGLKELDFVAGKVLKYKARFKHHFNLDAKIYLFNYQY